MYGYVYMVTNKLNGRKYIGKHKSNGFDDSYYGSGKVISQAIEKEGKDNFSVEILESYNSLAELNDGEKFFIKKFNAQEDPLFYNISEGGDGGRGMLGKHHSEETKQRISTSEKGKKQSEKSIEKYRETMRNKSEEELKLISHNKSISHLGKKVPKEQKEKISNTLKDGYRLGLYKSQKGRTAWNKGLKQSEEQRKMTSERMRGKKHITNGIDNKMVYAEDIEFYLNSGWVLGRTINKNKIKK